MVKVTFKQPDIVTQHGASQECKFVYCLFCIHEEDGFTRLIFGHDDYFLVDTFNVLIVEDV